jgi:hypothetical protein
MKTIGTIRREKGYGGRLARRDEEHRQDADEERMRNTCMARISTDGKDGDNDSGAHERPRAHTLITLMRKKEEQLDDVDQER